MHVNAPTQRIAYQPSSEEIKRLIWRSRGRITNKVLAERAGCHPSTISRVINGGIRDMRWMEWLAGQLGVPVQSIVIIQRGNGQGGRMKTRRAA